MTDLTAGKRDGHLKAEAVFASRAIALLLEGGVLKQAPYGEHAARKLLELLDEWEQSNPSPKQPNELADIKFVRDRIRI